MFTILKPTELAENKIGVIIIQPLNNCPFCGTKPVFSRIPGSGFSVVCPKCGAIAIRDKNESKDYLAKGWNNRSIRHNFSSVPDIKPCPFCSSRTSIGTIATNQLIIKCSNCGMMVSFAGARNKNDTVISWNKRAEA